MGPPVLFRHTRTGLHGRCFTLYKFRTMRGGRPGDRDAADLTRSVVRCAACRSTSCRSSGTCCAATCRWSARGRCCRSTSSATRRDRRAGTRSARASPGWRRSSGRNALAWEREVRARRVVRRPSQRRARPPRSCSHRRRGRASARGVSAPGTATMPEFIGRAPSTRTRAEGRCATS